jgi:hypothetical protein
MTAPATLDRGMYTDNMTAGLGIDLCRVCGYATRDHKVGPCPVLGMDLIYVAAGTTDRRENDGSGLCANFGCGNRCVPRTNSARLTKYCSGGCRTAYHRTKERQ